MTPNGVGEVRDFMPVSPVRRPMTAVLERSVYVPALNNASFNGGG
jgi:hypothetical protein